jgi:broad specificity phosphatase PhoE
MTRDRSQQATIVLVRHGETVSNLEGRVQGQQDSPLTQRGRAQGRQVAERLASLNIAAVYSSDVGRARETADLIAAPHGLAVATRRDLRERCYGELEGKTLDEAAAQGGEWLDAWTADRLRAAPPGGETEPQLARRVMAALLEIAAAHPAQTVAVATHGGPIKAAVFAILDIPLSSWDLTWIANGSITIVRGTPDLMRIAAFNDTCHLDEEPTPTWRISDIGRAE